MSDDLNAKLNDIELGSSFAGITLLRDVVIPELLSKNTSTILYWSGKSLAGQIPLPDFQGIQDFFVLAGLGTLTATKQKHNQYFYQLDGPIVDQRFAMTSTPDFQFETGFIAQQLQQQLGIVAEGISKPLKRNRGIEITIQTDPKDKVAATDADPLDR